MTAHGQVGKLELVDKYWLAAVIDSEGHLSIDRAGGPQLKIVNTNRDFLVRAQEIMGGRIYPHYMKPHPKHKPGYQLILARCGEIQKILSEVFDVLIVKKKAARVMLVLLNRKGKERFPIWKVLKMKGLR